MKKITTLLLVFSCLFVFSQHSGESLFSPRLPNYIPQSPTAYQLTKYGGIPVNESSGVADVGINLFNYNVGGLSVPVSLSYKTAGIKVDQVASWVGMGWDLNIGGVITRSVKGLADELNQRQFTSLTTVSALKANNLDPGFLNFGIDVLEGSDYQPDIYTFSFGNYSGTFYLDLNSTPVILKKENEIKIEKTPNGFILKTPDGIFYHFDGVGEYSRTESLSSGSSGHQNPSQLYQTTWFLTKISSYKGDEINFKYDYSTSYLYTTGFEQTITASSLPASNPVLSITSYKSYVQSRKVSEIYNNRDNSKIIFNATKSRPDLPNEYKLNTIELKDGNRLIKKYNFNYTSIFSNKNYIGAANKPWLNSSEHFYRLFLNSVKETDINGNDAKGQIHSFEYEDPSSLPPRMSFSQDVLGFYNGKQNSGYLPLSAGNYLGPHSLSGYSRGDRSPDFNFAKKGILTKVIYPTKGYTLLEYEPEVSNGTTKTGIRVKRVKNKKNTGSLEEITRYYYSSKEELNNNSTFTKLFTFQFIENQEGEIDDMFVFTSSSLGHYYLTLPQRFMYTTVTKSFGENFEGGGIEKHFHMNSVPTNLVVWGNPIPNSNATTNMSTLDNGRLEKEISFEKTSGGAIKIVNEKEYKYKDIDTHVADAFSARRRYLRSNIFMSDIQYLDGVDIESYKLYSRWSSLDSLITKNYFDNQVVTTIQSHKYDTDLVGLPIETTVITSDNSKTILTKNYYPKHVTSSGSLGYNSLGSTPVYSSLLAQHRLAIPIQVETQIKNGSTVLSNSVQRTKYATVNGMILPNSVQTLKGTYNSSNNILQDRIIYHDYYSNGKVKEISKKDGTRIVYIWGYDNRYPIAKIENATFSDIPSSNYNSIVSASNSDNDRTIGSTGNEGALRSALNNLRNLSSLSNAIITTYTYDPLIGVTSITNSNGLTSYYHYDEFNRLKEVRDKDGNIVNHYEYHYKGQ